MLLVAPCAPHFCEELWEQTGGKGSVFEQAYAKENPDALILDEKEYAVQVNSRMGSSVLGQENAFNTIFSARSRNFAIALMPSSLQGPPSV